MKTSPLYIALSSLLQRYHNLSQYAISATDMTDHCYDEALRLVRNHMPSGSGFDVGTALEVGASDTRRLVFTTSFHHMDESGGYDGWTDHKVQVFAEFGGFAITVSGRNRNGIKDYISETFYGLLSTDVTYQEMPKSQEAA